MLRQLHSQLTDAGFVYDDQKQRYFMKNDPVWDIQIKKASGKRQGAFPASTVEEFKKLELQWVEEVMRSAKNAKPKAEPVVAQEEAPVVEEEEEEKPKKSKKSTHVEEEPEVEEEEKPKKSKKSKRDEEAEEVEEEEEKPKKKKKKADKDEE